LKLGFISFGGPSGQIAIMHAELVEKKKWIGEERFLHALNFCMLLPGPEATQLATYCGWLLHRTWGGIAAGVLFVFPSALLLWLLSLVYVTYGQVAWIAAAFDGLKPAVTAIVVLAVIRIGRHALKTGLMWALAAAAFTALFFFHAPFPAVVAAASAIGFVGGKLFPKLFPATASTGPNKNVAIIDDRAAAPLHTRPSWARACKVLAVSLALWWTPVIAAGLWLGWPSTLARQGFFFSKAALVTFGGAYAVLPYVSQQAVEHYRWLSTAQMLDGLGLAETTPGPLIMVLQFVGFLGGWNQPGPLPPLIAATLGAALTTWTTFVPSFLFIFLGAPHIEHLRGKVHLSRALGAVTASVVGVILNLAVWFGLRVFFPAPSTIDWFALALSGSAVIAMQRFKVGVIPVVILSALAGAARHGLSI
jgi:chromate transporter